MINYTVRVATSDNQILAFINDFQSLKYVLRGDGQITVCELTVPISYGNIFGPDKLDYRVTVWRSVNNQVAQLDGSTEFLVRKWVFTNTHIVVTAVSIQGLLGRRINAYAANNTTYTNFTNKYAGNIMKALVRYNLTSSFSATFRDGNDDYVAVANLTVAGDMNDGILMNIGCSRDNVYETVMKISQTSITAGAWIIGQIVSDGSAWTFNTYPSFLGINRTGQVMLSISNRNIENVELTYDRTDEKTAVITGGKGTDKARVIGTAFSAEITASQYNRTELFYSQPQAKKVVFANDWSNAVLRQSRASFGFQADILQTPNFVRGIDFNVGDILRLSFLDVIYNVRLDVVSVTVANGNINERADLRLL